MTNKSLVALYKSQIDETKVKMQKSKARFEAEEHKNCNKYPSFMREEMQEKIINSYKNDIEQLENLILELI